LLLVMMVITKCECELRKTATEVNKC
jgi:hypothetical protein